MQRYELDPSKTSESDKFVSGFLSYTSIRLKSEFGFEAFEKKISVRHSIDVASHFLRGYIDVRPNLQKETRPHRNSPADITFRRWFSELIGTPEQKKANSTQPPKAAPESWLEKRRDGETPPEFIKRIYGKWLGKGLTKADILHLDEPLYKALAKHLNKTKEPLPFDLPTKREVMDRKLQSEFGGDSYETLRNLERAASAMRRRLAERTQVAMA